jgi:hypothetical protein
VALRRTTKIRRAVRKVLRTPLPPFWAWKQTPKQRDQSLKIRLWLYGAAILIGTAFRYPWVSLAILASIVCGAMIALFLGRSNEHTASGIRIEPPKGDAK